MIKLHHSPETRSMRSLWLLHELAIAFEVETHAFDKSLRAPDYLKLSPAGRVPALEIDGMRMFETGAITEYLCERFPSANLGRMPGDPERAEWLIWVHFSETISQHMAALTQQHIAIYKDEMRSPTVMKLEAARLKKCYAALEDQLEDREHLLRSSVTAVDISVGQSIYMALHFATLDEFPRTAAWFQRITERPGFKAALPGPDDPVLYKKPFYPAWEVAL
jgi:glutathione S-transferase